MSLHGHFPTSFGTVVVLFIGSEKYFISLIFIAIEAYENISTTKISQFRVIDYTKN